MIANSPQAYKRRMRRLRKNNGRLVVHLHTKWQPVAGKDAPERIGGEAVTLEWEQELQQHFTAECKASGHHQAVNWLTNIVHTAAAIDAHFQADLMAAAMSFGVHVPLKIASLQMLGPGRRSPVVPNSLRVAWSRGSR